VKQSKRIAECGMMTALSVAVMIIGCVLGVGLYASPMIAGLLLLPLGRKYGAKYHAALWLAVSLLCFILVPEIEQNLMYFCFFGYYPLLYPYFYRLRPPLRRICKFLFFNFVIIAVEALVMFVLVPESMHPALLLSFLALFNLTFICYDFLVPRFEVLLRHYTGKLKR